MATWVIWTRSNHTTTSPKISNHSLTPAESTPTESDQKISKVIKSDQIEEPFFNFACLAVPSRSPETLQNKAFQHFFTLADRGYLK